MAREFVLVRVTRMRDVNLDLFDFDYDLTWMAFFVDPRMRVLGRYGGRDADSAEGRVSLDGLRYAMKRALQKHSSGKAEPAPKRDKPRTVMAYSAARDLPEKACVRCHQVYDVRRKSLQAENKWSRDEVWVYPLPENVGLTLAVDQGDRVERVKEKSPAAEAGLKKGDVLVDVNGTSIASFADLQYALHRAPARGTIAATWTRDGKAMKAPLALAQGWKKTDVSWRWSLRGLDPPPEIHGDDLTPAEKKALGLAPSRLALRQGEFVSARARQAGVRQGDVIVGIDGKTPEMTARQFLAHVRLTYKVGDRVTYNLLRDGKRIDATLTLRARQ